MNKEIKSWSIAELRDVFPSIDFPEYQREPNLWSPVEKQRLIDSVVRRFDIASLYLYKHEDGTLDCVDGRQRIGAIMSFLGLNSSDGTAIFPFRHLNEIYEDVSLYISLENKTFDEIEQLAKEQDDKIAIEFLDLFLSYPLTIVMLTDSHTPEEFNLQFTRLNLGTINNSGEKLHAMMGDLRNQCFEELGKHAFLKSADIPTRRFAQEQVAAQLIAQIFSLNDSKQFARVRHVDLQRIFKQHATLDAEHNGLIASVKDILDRLAIPFASMNVLRNRAMTVSTVLLAWNSNVKTDAEASELAAFMQAFVNTLSSQVRKGLSADPEYHYLIEFQRNVTQASAEASGFAARARTLQTEFERWQASGEFKGDAEWKERHPGEDPRSQQ